MTKTSWNAEDFERSVREEVERVTPKETHKTDSRLGGKNEESDGATRKGGKQLVVHNADAVDPEAIDWLWPGRIAVGKTTLVGGDPGLGKSQLSIFITATITRAGEWPCHEGRPPEKRSVIMLSAEDGVADTIVPRLMAAGADRTGQDYHGGS